MNKNGGFTWIQTCATVVCSVKNADEQNIVCVNYIITNREDGNFVLDQCQLGIIKREPTVYSRKDNEPKTPDTNGDNSKSGPDGKTNVNSSESKSSVAPSSLESSLKVVENSGHNFEEETLSLATTKRGRKRKVKCESKDDSRPIHTPPIQIDQNVTNENHSDITVKQLENVLSKHLPKSAMNDHSSDFSTNSLLRLHSDEKNQSIQPGAFTHQSPAPMPASALLRQLYANRESVIRATSRPGNYMYNDSSQQQSLPTPPNDSYESQYFRKSGDSFNSLVSSYNAYSSMEYNNAMTPPSSVSPRDLTSHKASGSYDYSNLTTSGDSRLQYQTNHQVEHLPLKPQPYSIHQMEPSYSIDHQSQYFPYHSGFHLYHKGVYTPP